MKASLTVRATVEDDWAALQTVRLAALRDAPTAFGVTHASAAAIGEDGWRARAAGRMGPVFWLAWNGGEPVGLAGGGVAADGRYNLIAMWVAPAWRGTGVAARLVEAVQAHAVAAGHARVVLDVAPDNARAAAFYRRRGFGFIDEWEPLASHPEIRVRKMVWTALS
jgi:ribosomal protein S18 acetylase RimI-like enzyme